MLTEIGTQALLPQPGGGITAAHLLGGYQWIQEWQLFLSLWKIRKRSKQLNHLLHEAGQYIIGRMGIPYREKGINIISIAIDAPQDVISTLSGKIGRLSGISTKTAYSNIITKAGE